MALKALDQRMATKPAASVSAASSSSPQIGGGSTVPMASPRLATVASLGGQPLLGGGANESGDIGEGGGVEMDSKK